MELGSPIRVVNYSGSYGMNHSMKIHPVYILRYVVFDICLHNYSIIYQKSNLGEGNIRKRGAPGGENSLTGGAVQGIEQGGGLDRGRGRG